MNKDELDQMFDAAFEKAAKGHHAVPNPSESWRKVERRLHKSHSSQIMSMRLLPFALAASFICGALLFGSPSVTKAFHPAIQSMIAVKSDVVSFLFQRENDRTGHALTAPPPSTDLNDDGHFIIDVQYTLGYPYSTWEEAAKHTLFPTLKMNYIPDNYELEAAILLNQTIEQKAGKAILIYNAHSIDQSLTVNIQYIEENHSIASSYSRSSGSYESILINGSTGYLIQANDDRVKLEYILDNCLVTISGLLTKEQVLKIAESIT